LGLISGKLTSDPVSCGSEFGLGSFLLDFIAYMWLGDAMMGVNGLLLVCDVEVVPYMAYNSCGTQYYY
jgi:hypothetical protein